MGQPDTTLACKVMDSVSTKIGYLKGRWMDERSHEDFADYAKVLADLTNAVDGVTFVGADKKFNITWRGHDGYVRVTSLKRNTLQTTRLPA